MKKRMLKFLALAALVAVGAQAQWIWLGPCSFRQAYGYTALAVPNCSYAYDCNGEMGLQCKHETCVQLAQYPPYDVIAYDFGQGCVWEGLCHSTATTFCVGAP